MKRALAELRHHPGRLVAVLLAIVIGVGFLTTTQVFLGTESAAVRSQAVAPVSRADVIISRDSDQPGMTVAEARAAAEAAAAVPGVAESHASFQTWATAGRAQVQVNESAPADLRWAELRDGAWPTDPGQITVDAGLAERLGLAIGDPMELVISDGEGMPAEFTVVGTTVPAQTLLSGVSQHVFVAPQWFSDDDTYAQGVVAVRATPGADVSTVIEAVRAAVDPTAELTVATRDDYADASLASLSGGTDVFSMVGTAFGAIALLVAMLIIANTFTILIAQRRRQIGLLRAIGAGTGQVRAGLLIEASLIGVVGSALGVGLGIGLATIAATLSGSLRYGLVVPTGVLIAGLVGIVVTVAAAWVPSLRTSAIAPLEALRAASDDHQRARPGPVVAVIAGLCLAGGVAAVLLATLSDGNQLIMAIAAGFGLSIGTLLLAGWYVPAVVSGLGRLLTRVGNRPTARLAAANAVRNPRRTAATCVALMLAVGLIATLQVGSASVKTSAERGIADRFPVPISLIMGSDDSVDPQLQSQVAALEGVTGATTVLRGDTELGGEAWSVLGLRPDATAVLGAMPVSDSEIMFSPDQLTSLPWRAGQILLAGQGSSTVELTVRSGRVATEGPVVTAATLERISPDVAPGGIWAATEVREAGDGQQLLDRLGELVGPDVFVSGSLSFVITLTQVLDLLLAVATALLAAAVGIALIGVGNTLGLSVLERTRESALLRALGLQRGQLRAMLALEAILLALTGAAIGIVAGIGLGYLGAWAVMTEIGEPAYLAVSPTLLAADAAIALVAGLLASVLPARRAARVAPAAALAEA